MGVATHTFTLSSWKAAYILRPGTVRAAYRDPVSEKESGVERKVCFLGPEARTSFLPQYPTFTPLT